MDSYIITNPAGSQIDIGTYLIKESGLDFGLKDLIRHVQTKNPHSEAAALAFDDTSTRLFEFRLRLASSSVFSQGLAGAESFLRGAARPGGYIDLKPEGVATGDMVRFDLISGRYEPEYNLDLQKHGRREGLLYLDVKPFGYSPSTLVLASVASTYLGAVPVPGGSVIGDALGLAEVVLQPTVASAYRSGWASDVVAWSLAGRASFVAFWPPASIASSISGGASVADSFAPAGNVLQLTLSKTLPWSNVAVATIPVAREPAYRGRFRAFAFAKWGTAQTQPFYLSLDAAVQPAAPFASWANVATLYTSAAFAGSPAHQVIDLGELYLPPVASGVPQDVQLRVWAAAPTTMSATPVVQLGGLYLLPVEGPAGVLVDGLSLPGNPPAKAAFLSTDTRRVIVSQATQDIGSYYPLAAGDPNYRGVAPYIAASTVQLDSFVAQRATPGATAGSPYALAGVNFQAARVAYQPRFYFLKAV